jgi:hypothetical protein
MRPTFLACCAFLAFVTAVPGFSQELVTQDTGVVVYERYSDSVRVGSPNVFVGLVTAAPPGRADPQQLTIFVPRRGADSLCIDLISDDGWYEARFAYPRPRYAGQQTITLPARLVGRMREYGPTRLAALVHLSRRCSGDPEVVLPAGWGPSASPHHLRLLLNPTNVEEVNIRPTGTDQLTRCARLRRVGQIAYNYACDVDVSRFRGERTFSILRRQPVGPRLPAIPIRVWVPDGT